jgi:hypothetical protein
MPDSKDNSASPSQGFTPAPSSRALALVAIAIIAGLILVGIVDADKTSKKNPSANASNTTTTTVKATTTSTTTSTTKPVSGTKDPEDVSVLTLNGSAIAGVAAKVTTELDKVKYHTLTAGNDTSKDTGTFVYYKSGFQKDAQQLSTNVLPGILKTLKITQTIKTKAFPASAPSTWDQADLLTANIVVVVGNAS